VHVDTDAEVFRLRALLRDLVALSAIPGGWIGKDPRDIAAGLADALVGLLQLDFGFVRLCDPGRSDAVDVTRGDGWQEFPEWLEGHLATGAPFPGREIVPGVGGGPEPCVGIAIPIGVNGEGGIVAAACERGDFPNESDQLLLSLAANQAATAFQSARLIVDRTAELRRSEAYLAQLADEQAALRRVATLVAEGTSPTAVFEAVTEEMERQLGADEVTLARYESSDEVTVVADCGSGPRRLPPGTRVSHRGENVTSRVRRLERPARIEHRPGARGPIAELVDARGGRASVGTPIVVDGRLWGIAVGTWKGESPPADTEERMARFGRLLETAIANAETRSELIASRARLVAASDEARRRFERDLHDGVQQRLVGLALKLHGAETMVAEDQPLASELADLGEGLNGVLEDLRELSRGIHPAILAQGGLDPAIRALARRSGVPVVLDLAVDGRLAEPVEVAAYYVVSEALTNAAKHANSSRAEVTITSSEGVLEVSIQDDGVGGAHPVHGSGLAGLRDRVEAVGGTITIKSPVRDGTSLHVSFPTRADSVHPEGR
jgi:signal transduction histidine kinase